MSKAKGLKAWLITWDWCGDHARPDDDNVEILSPRLSPERVRELAELIYHRTSSLSEKISWRLRKEGRVNPAAEFAIVDGIPYHGWITCGNNPFVIARRVKNLSVITDVNGRQALTWKDECTPREAADKIRQLRMSLK
jgi:hypothetical protein